MRNTSNRKTRTESMVARATLAGDCTLYSRVLFAHCSATWRDPSGGIIFFTQAFRAHALLLLLLRELVLVSFSLFFAINRQSYDDRVIYMQQSMRRIFPRAAFFSVPCSTRYNCYDFLLLFFSDKLRIEQRE